MTIQDKLTGLPMSRQRKYQLRKLKEDRCTQCGTPCGRWSRKCEGCLIKGREYNKRYYKAKRGQHA
jgi:hypothetical protein